MHIGDTVTATLTPTRYEAACTCTCPTTQHMHGEGDSHTQAGMEKGACVTHISHTWCRYYSHLACFACCLVEAVADDCGVDALLQHLLSLLQQGTTNHHNRCGAVTSNNILHDNSGSTSQDAVGCADCSMRMMWCGIALLAQSYRVCRERGSRPAVPPKKLPGSGMASCLTSYARGCGCLVLQPAACMSKAATRWSHPSSGSHLAQLHDYCLEDRWCYLKERPLLD
jgi:hypothetical protein